MKPHLPKMLFAALAMACSMAQAVITTVEQDTVSIPGVAFEESKTITLLNSTQQDALTAEQSADYVVLGKGVTSDSNGRYKVTSDVFTGDNATIIIGGGTYARNGEDGAEPTETNFAGGQLFIDASGTSGVTIDNAIVIGSCSYTEGGDNNTYGGALRLHESAPGKKIILTNSVTLLNDAHMSVGTSEHNYIEGALNGVGKNLTVDNYSGAKLKLSGGATLQTLAGSASVVLDDKKADGSTEAASKTYTVNNLTGTGAVTVDSSVTLNLLGDTDDGGSLVQSTKNITLNGGTLVLGDYTDTARYISLTGDVAKGSNTNPEVLIGKTVQIELEDGASITAAAIKFGKNNYASTSSLVVKDGASVTTSGTVDMANGGGASSAGEIHFKSGSTGTLNGLFMHINNTVTVEQGATLKVTSAGVELSGSNSEVAAEINKDGNAGAAFGLGNSEYTVSNAAVKVTGNVGTTVALALSGTYSLENAYSGKVTEKNATNITYDAIKATTGDMTFLNKANGLSVNALTLSAGKTVAAYVGDSESTDLTSITVNTSLTIEGDATIAASALTLGDNTTLDFSGSVTLNGTLTLGSDMVLSDAMIARLSNGGGITLFTGLSGITNVSGELDVLASEWFTNVEFAENGALGHMHLCYAGGKLQLIPEPATATLSLLALCGLAARRRRR